MSNQTNVSNKPNRPAIVPWLTNARALWINLVVMFVLLYWRALLIGATLVCIQLALWLRAAMAWLTS